MNASLVGNTTSEWTVWVNKSFFLDSLVSWAYGNEQALVQILVVLLTVEILRWSCFSWARFRLKYQQPNLPSCFWPKSSIDEPIAFFLLSSIQNLIYPKPFPHCKTNSHRDPYHTYSESWIRNTHFVVCTTWSFWFETLPWTVIASTKVRFKKKCLYPVLKDR